MSQQIDDKRKEVYRAEYAPAPEIPSWFEARLRALGMRVVWGMDARGFPWPDNRQVKYVSPNDPEVGWACFILEQFVEPAFFGDPDDWEKNRWKWVDGRLVETMAPYPSRGEWVFVQQLATPDGEPMPLNEQVADYVSWLVRTHHQRPLNGFTNQTEIAARIDAIKKLREERRKETDAQLETVFDEAATKSEETNTRATREWNKVPAAALARARQFLANKGAKQ